MWEIKQLDKLRLLKPELVSSALQLLLHQNRELRESLVIGAYLDEEINFGKAAELLELDHLGLREYFLSRGIPIRLGPQSKDDLLAEIHSAELISQES